MIGIFGYDAEDSGRVFLVLYSVREKSSSYLIWILERRETNTACPE